MADAKRDLWPNDLAAETEPAPLAILHEQAEVLKEKTNGMLEGEVYSRPERGRQACPFLHEFRIRAPAFNDYRYSLLDVRHDFDPYPLSVRYKPAATEYEATSEEEYVSILAEVFSRPETKRVIQSLLAQIKAQADEVV